MTKTPDRHQVLERDHSFWAAPVDRLAMTSPTSGGSDRHVTGRRITSPIHGFGQLWRKTYRLRLSGVQLTPEKVVAEWKAHFAEFWPDGSAWHGSADGIRPGDVALIDMSSGGLKVSTGVMVIYADKTSFTVMTPEGHGLAGFNTWSAYRDVDGEIVAQIEPLFRASDPLVEAVFAVGVGHRMEDRQWIHVLTRLGEHLGAQPASVSKERLLLDQSRQWRLWGNIRQSATLASALDPVAGLWRRLVRRLRRPRKRT